MQLTVYFFVPPFLFVAITCCSFVVESRISNRCKLNMNRITRRLICMTEKSDPYATLEIKLQL